jgi:hypothetical protein
VWRLALTWIVLLAFSLQTYVTQTHSHITAGPATREAAAGLAGKVAVDSASALGDDAAACPLCQLIAAAGFFVTPVAAASQPVTDWVFQPVIAETIRGLAARPTGFAWRSRAPPQA